MTDEVREWLDKAANDFDAARDLIAAARPHHDLVCFLCQQSTEKLMKAAIIARNVTPPKTHDLVHLHERLQAVAPSWEWDAKELDRLSRGAVTYRYPANPPHPRTPRGPLKQLPASSKR